MFKLNSLMTICLSLLFSWSLEAEQSIKIGWISPLSGGAEKYAAHKSLDLALKHIQEAGGINGKKLEVIREDGKCHQRSAISSAKKLVQFDKVNIIIGGHCSPESETIAPFMERRKKIMLASISSTPSLSRYADYVFRTSPNAKFYAPVLAEDILQRKLRTFVIVYEDTAYTHYPANHLETLLEQQGVRVWSFSFDASDKELRGIVTKIRHLNPEGIYVATQTQDTAALIFRLFKEYQIRSSLYGNEVTASTPNFFPVLADVFKNLRYAEVAYDSRNPLVKRFAQQYHAMHKELVPYGFWNAEAYDGVMLLAAVLRRCGQEVEQVRTCLKHLDTYQGVSGPIRFDEKGDAIREYVLKVVP